MRRQFLVYSHQVVTLRRSFIKQLTNLLNQLQALKAKATYKAKQDTSFEHDASALVTSTEASRIKKE